MLVKDSQSINASSFIFVVPAFITTSSNKIQPLNIPLPKTSFS